MEMHQCSLRPLLRALSKTPKLRTLALRLAFKMEGNHFYSLTARWMLAHYHGVQIGNYSYGECFVPGAFPSGVTIGRYVSVGPGVRAFLRNHPLDRLSTHPFFYNQSLGLVDRDNIDSGRLEIGHDSWIGAGALILPGCSKIGIGAVVGAGAVVTKNIPDFAVAVGNPARTIRFRFPPNICQSILASRWWEKPVSECAKHLTEMTEKLDKIITHHSLLQSGLSAVRAKNPEAVAVA